MARFGRGGVGGGVRIGLGIGRRRGGGEGSLEWGALAEEGLHSTVLTPTVAVTMEGLGTAVLLVRR